MFALDAGMRVDPPVLTTLRVGGFKSISEPFDVRLAPITVLAGPNSSGKSSLMQPLLLLKQTLEATYDPGPLLLTGPNVKFSAADQLLARTSPNKADVSPAFTVRAAFSSAPGSTYELEFAREQSKRLGVVRASATFGAQKVQLRPDMTSEEVAKQIDKILDKESRSVLDRLSRPDKMRWAIRRNRCFLVPDSSATRDGVEYRIGYPTRMSYLQSSYSDAVMSIIHLPGLRGNPERTYDVAAVGQRFPGLFTSYAASVIASWQDNGESEKIRALGKDLEALDLTWKVEARRIGETQVELQVGRLKRAARGGAKDLVNIVDVGFGMSQSLPLLVALHAAGKGDLVYVEQPEIHLHPTAQYRLAGLIHAASLRGVRFVVETHSSLFIIGLQVLIAEKGLEPEQFALHWLNRDKLGVSRITTAQIENDGSLGEWPSDFDEVLMRAQGDYLTAVGLRR